MLVEIEKKLKIEFINKYKGYKYYYRGKSTSKQQKSERKNAKS